MLSPAERERARELLRELEARPAHRGTQCSWDQSPPVPCAACDSAATAQLRLQALGERYLLPVALALQGELDDHGCTDPNSEEALDALLSAVVNE